MSPIPFTGEKLVALCDQGQAHLSLVDLVSTTQEQVLAEFFAVRQPVSIDRPDALADNGYIAAAGNDQLAAATQARVRPGGFVQVNVGTGPTLPCFF